MAPSQADVCVVGGGPAGLLLGLAPGQARGPGDRARGARDLRPRVPRRGAAAEHGAPPRRDRAARVRPGPAPPDLDHAAGSWSTGRRRAGSTSGTIAPEYPYAIWMPQPVFLEALVRKAGEFPGFQCWMGARVTELVEENGAVVGVRGRRHGAEPFEVRADVVVGADGRHSTIAAAGRVRDRVRARRLRRDLVRRRARRRTGPRRSTSRWARCRFCCCPKYPNEIQVGLLLSKGDWRALAAGGRGGGGRRASGGSTRCSPTSRRDCATSRPSSPCRP